MPGETRKEMIERKAREFNELIESYRHRPDHGRTMAETLEPNPHGYNVGQIIGISMGYGRMFSKSFSEQK